MVHKSLKVITKEELGTRLDHLKRCEFSYGDFPVKTTTPFLDRDIVTYADGTKGYVWYLEVEFDKYSRYEQRTTHSTNHTRSLYTSYNKKYWI